MEYVKILCFKKYILYYILHVRNYRIYACVQILVYTVIRKKSMKCLVLYMKLQNLLSFILFISSVQSN